MLKDLSIFTLHRNFKWLIPLLRVSYRLLNKSSESLNYRLWYDSVFKGLLSRSQETRNIKGSSMDTDLYFSSGSQWFKSLGLLLWDFILLYYRYSYSNHSYIVIVSLSVVFGIFSSGPEIRIRVVESRHCTSYEMNSGGYGVTRVGLLVRFWLERSNQSPKSLHYLRLIILINI